MLSPTVAALIAGRELPRHVGPDTVAQAQRGGLAPLLFTEAKRQGCEMERSIRLQLARRHLRAVAHRSLVLADIARLRERCTDHGVELFLYKGIANAEMLYEAHSDRHGSDVDLYVGDWPARGRSAVLRSLGVTAVQAAALERLDTAGRPLHEITIKGADAMTTVNIDAHFNPYGLITVFHGRHIADAWRTVPLDEIGPVQMPTPELALIIALMNLTRKGGSTLWNAVDSVRLIRGDAGVLDWDRYEWLAAADGLASICAQAVWAVADDVGVEFDIAVPRPRRRRRWAPSLGESLPPLSRRMTLVPLYRPRRFAPESLGTFARWYMPGSDLLDALGVPLHASNWRRKWSYLQWRSGLQRRSGRRAAAG